MLDRISSGFTQTTKWLYEFFSPKQNNPNNKNNSRAVAKMNEILFRPFESIEKEKNENIKKQWSDYYKNQKSNEDNTQSYILDARHCIHLFSEEEKSYYRKKSHFLYHSGLLMASFLLRTAVIAFDHPSERGIFARMDQEGCHLFDCDEFGSPSFYFMFALFLAFDKLNVASFFWAIPSIPKMQSHHLSDSANKFYKNFVDKLPHDLKNSFQPNMLIVDVIKALEKLVLDLERDVVYERRKTAIKQMLAFFAGAEDVRSQNVYHFFQQGGYEVSEKIFNELLYTEEVHKKVDQFTEAYKKTSASVLKK